MTKKGKGHQKFWAWKWKFFRKKTSFRNLGLPFCPSPQTRRQVSAYGKTPSHTSKKCHESHESQSIL